MYEQQPGIQGQQQPMFEPTMTQESITITSQQAEPFEPVPPLQQQDCMPAPIPQEPYVQQTPQPVYQASVQQTYPAQQFIYEPAQVQMQQQQVTVSYQVPTYTLESTPTVVPQPQTPQPVQPIYIPNNQPEIITSDAHLVEVPGTPDTTTLVLNSGYGGNDILAGTSLAAEQNVVVSQPPQGDVVQVTIDQTRSPLVQTACGPDRKSVV